MTPNSLPLEARLLVSAPDTSAGRFMYMPAGRHVITPSCQGKPVTVVVDVKPVEAAAALNRQLDAVRRTSAPQRPYFDFNHEKDRASFWPERFEAGGDGVYVIGEFSASGKAAVEGKDYRAFSPLFYTDAEIPLQALRSAPSLTIAPGKLGSAEAPAQVICFESAGLNFGGLVNEPAFRAMQPLFAKSAEAAGAPSEVENQTNTDTMKKTIAELQAANAALDTKVKALAAKADKTEIETAQLAAHQAEQRATALELEAAQRRADDAKAHVAAAVADGRIPAQNTELQAKWTQQLTDDASALVLLAALPKSPLAAKAAPLVGITRESSLAVLNAFAAEADPKKRAALYAREIKARLKEGDPLPLEGANSLGTLAGTLVTQRVLELLKFQFPMLNRVSTDFSDVQSRKGQAVVSRIVGIPTVVDYDPANGWVDQDASTTDVTVTLNKQRGVPHTFTADVLASTVIGVLGFSERLPVGVHGFLVRHPCRDCSWPPELPASDAA